MVLMRRPCIVLAACVALLSCGGAASGTADAPPSQGELLYNTHCATCHGRSGDLGMSGAKDLTVSMLAREEAIAIITNGKAGMMAYGTMLSKQEIGAVADHVIALRRSKPAE